MLSQTKKAKDVRKYFLEIEKLVRQFHEEIQVNAVGVYVYVFETPYSDF